MVGYMTTLIQSPSNSDPCAHTHLLHRSCHCWMHWQDASLGIFRSSAVAFDSMSSMVRNASPWGPFSEQATAESPSERDESTVVGWWQECFSRRGIAAQQAMCGSVCHRDAENTRNKPRTNKSHIQIVRQNRMNGSVRDASVLFQLHDGHSSNSTMVILRSYWISCRNFSNQRNSGNFLTSLRTATKDSINLSVILLQNFVTFLKLEQLQVEIHVYCFEKRKIIILRQSLKDTRKKK
jgi:hypothetical protein